MSERIPASEKTSEDINAQIERISANLGSLAIDKGLDDYGSTVKIPLMPAGSLKSLDHQTGNNLYFKPGEGSLLVEEIDDTTGQRLRTGHGMKIKDGKASTHRPMFEDYIAPVRTSSTDDPRTVARVSARTLGRIKDDVYSKAREAQHREESEENRQAQEQIKEQKEADKKIFNDKSSRLL